MKHYHAVVWLDHAHARVFSLNAEAFDEATLSPDHPSVGHIHHKAGTMGSGKAKEDAEFLHKIAEAVSPAGEFLVVGPGTAKLEFLRHIQKHDPQLEAKLIAIETVDHPTDRQLVAYARKYFHAADRMRA